MGAARKRELIAHVIGRLVLLCLQLQDQQAQIAQERIGLPKYRGERFRQGVSVLHIVAAGYQPERDRGRAPRDWVTPSPAA